MPVVYFINTIQYLFNVMKRFLLTLCKSNKLLGVCIMESENERIRETDAFLRSSIDLIPIDNWGFDEAIKERLKQRKHRLVNAKLTPNEKKKLSRAAKQRLAKADDDMCRTITQVFDWMASTNFSDTKPRPFTQRKSVEKSNNTRSNNMNANQDLYNDGVKSKKKVKRIKQNDVVNKRPLNRTESGSNGTAMSVTDRHETLQQKLQARIDQLKCDRMGKMNVAEYEERKRLKRRKSKLSSKERKKLQKTTVQHNKNANEKVQKESNKSTGLTKPVIRAEDGKIVFSKFDFVVNERNPPENSKKAKKEQRRTNKKNCSDKGKDYKRLLEKVGREEEKIENLREKDIGKANRLEQNIRWNKAVRRAQGDKVKDNAELLKKGLKRKEQQKKRSERKWKARERTVAVDRQKRQQKRTANIQKRRQDRRR